MYEDWPEIKWFCFRGAGGRASVPAKSSWQCQLGAGGSAHLWKEGRTFGQKEPFIILSCWAHCLSAGLSNTYSLQNKTKQNIWVNDKILPSSLVNGKQEGQWLCLGHPSPEPSLNLENYAAGKTRRRAGSTDWPCRGDTRVPRVQAQTGDTTANFQREKINLSWTASVQWN